MKPTENLVRIEEAAKQLGLKRVTFVARKYPVAMNIAGLKLYDIDELKAIKFIDKRRKNGLPKN
jgi:hypothetical protein